MGISIQQYRSQVGLFNGSRNSYLRTRCKSLENSKIKAKPNLKILFALFLICLNLGLRLDNVMPLNQNVCRPFSSRSFSSPSCILLNKSTFIEDYNFLARYNHGNIRGSGLRLCHWNKPDKQQK